MEMIEEKKFCRQQIIKTIKDLKFKISFGSTVDKLDNIHFQYYTSEKIKGNLVKERLEIETKKFG